MQQLLNQHESSQEQLSRNNNISINQPQESSSTIISNHLKRKNKVKCNGSNTALIMQDDLIVVNQNKKQQAKTTVQYVKKQCRICLEDQSQGRIINPCKCIGSMSFAHQKCLAQWIKKKIDFKTKVRCEVCDEQFIYKLGKSLSLSCDQLTKNYYRQPSTFRCFIGIMALLIIIWLSLVILVALASDPNNGEAIRQTFMKESSTRIVFICVVFVFLIVLVFIFLLFFAQYGIHTQLIIKNISSYGSAPLKKKQIKVYQSTP